jgi:hypothetical protein
MKTEFLKTNITPEWQDLVDEFPEFIFDLSPHLKRLIQDHPESFETVDELCNLRYGFECSVGWKNLIRKHFLKIKNLIDEAKKEGHEINYRPFILKEKMGTLRDQGEFFGEDIMMYSGHYYDILGDTYAESSKTCEVTGEEGFLCHSGNGWYKTLSQEMIESNYNRMEWVKI